MRKKYILSFIAVLGWLLPGLLFAHAGDHTHYPAISADYNSQMIADSVFRAKTTMTEAQIQQFLVDKGSALARYTIPTDGSVPTTIGWDFKVEAKGWSAAAVIYWSAQWYDINPQVLLSTLQKESSLVTSGNLNNLRGAMGYACPETSACNPFYYGFARQMDGASYQFMHNYNGSEEKNTNKVEIYYRGNTIVLDGKSTYIGNSATASLYRYTPHRPDSAQYYDSWGNVVTSHYYGNYNFISFLNKWFDFSKYLQDNFAISNYTLSNGSPAKGETVEVNFSLKNNLSTAITIDAVGLVGRLGSVSSATSRDFGWFGSTAFTSGETKSFKYTYLVKDTGSLYIWPSFYYQGYFSHYYQGWTVMSLRLPNLGITTNLSSSPSPLFIGQDIPVSVSVKNNEPNPIKYDALGIASRYGLVNKDITWSTNSSFTPGETKILSGILKPDQAGTYVSWLAIQQSGEFRLIKATDGMQYLVSYVINPYADFLFSNYTVSTVTPAKGDTVTASFTLRNNLPAPITIGSIGFVAKLNGISSGIHRDFGWYPSVTFAANETKTFNYSTVIKDSGTLYVWPVLYYQGYYLHYLMGWTNLKTI